MSPVFDTYARYYDLLYQEKDYAAEAGYIDGHIKKQEQNTKSILELGCGTGAHAEHLARMGYVVHGVDMSETMLACAEARKATLSSEVASRLTFSLGDVRTVRVGKTYDAVISLFHVMSYQTTTADLENAFETAFVHLQPGGLFLFDFWYGPSVLTQKAEVRVKRLEDNDIKVIRIAEPVMHANENVVDVNYTVFIEVKETGIVEQVYETHRMRYLFLPELEVFLSGSGLQLLAPLAWMTDEPPACEHWAGFVVASRVRL